ncbi:MAG: alkaline phosphatase family protein, partial [Candidatus Freyarchaeota archaeon]|nr:alkaline phosphatase family protein [Candidatus Jordarchaeia archaeon]
MKVLLLGIDGATWNVILPLVEQGKLPTFKQLIENGVWANLESTIPFLSSPAWKSYSTGKNPGKLGLFGWCRFDIKNLELRVNVNTPSRTPEIWDYLGEHGLTSGVVNLPLSLPPKAIRGFIVSGPPMFDSSEYTFPKDLKKDLVEKFGYRINPSAYSFEPKQLLSNKRILAQEVEELIKKRFKAAKYLIELYSPDFFQLTLFYTDVIQHFFWKEMETKDEKFGQVIEKIWETIDKEIGSLIASLKEDTNILIMSDHGFTGVKATFYLNTWFLEKGYLNLSLIDVLLTKLRLYARKTSQSFSRLRLGGLSRLMPRRNLIRLLLRISSRESSNLLNQADWAKTKAISVGECGIFLNPNLNREEYEKLRLKLMKEIKTIIDPRTGEYLVADVKKKEEIYHGEHMDFAPDLVVVPNEGYRVYDSLMRGVWDFENRVWSAYHTLHGVFLACGPDIKNWGRIGDVKIYDLAPTILHMF